MRQFDRNFTASSMACLGTGEPLFLAERRAISAQPLHEMSLSVAASPQRAAALHLATFPDLLGRQDDLERLGQRRVDPRLPRVVHHARHFRQHQRAHAVAVHLPAAALGQQQAVGHLRVQHEVDALGDHRPVRPASRRVALGQKRHHRQRGHGDAVRGRTFKRAVGMLVLRQVRQRLVDGLVQGLVELGQPEPASSARATGEGKQCRHQREVPGNIQRVAPGGSLVIGHLTFVISCPACRPCGRFPGSTP